MTRAYLASCLVLGGLFVACQFAPLAHGVPAMPTTITGLPTTGIPTSATPSKFVHPSAAYPVGAEAATIASITQAQQAALDFAAYQQDTAQLGAPNDLLFYDEFDQVVLNADHWQSAGTGTLPIGMVTGVGTNSDFGAARLTIGSGLNLSVSSRLKVPLYNGDWTFNGRVLVQFTGGNVGCFIGLSDPVTTNLTGFEFQATPNVWRYYVNGTMTATAVAPNGAQFQNLRIIKSGSATNFFIDTLNVGNTTQLSYPNPVNLVMSDTSAGGGGTMQVWVDHIKMISQRF